MNIAELIQRVQQSKPELLKDLPEERARALVMAIYGQIKGPIVLTAEGDVQFPGLGLFRIRKVAKEVNGRQVVRKQVRFLPAGRMRGMLKKNKPVRR